MATVLFDADGGENSKVKARTGTMPQKNSAFSDENYWAENYRSGTYVPPGNYQQINGDFSVHFEHGGFLPRGRDGQATCFRHVLSSHPALRDPHPSSEAPASEDTVAFDFLYLVLPHVRFPQGGSAK